MIDHAARSNPENEYAVNTDAAYVDDLQDQARAAGITVPITHNACCDAASWSSTWASGRARSSFRESTITHNRSIARTT